MADVLGADRHVDHRELGSCPVKEAKMRRQFGADFEAYTRKVGRWI
jgi:hypothetical protein